MKSTVGMVAGQRKEPDHEGHTVRLPRGLADEIERFLAENAGFGIRNVSEFTVRGTSEFLRTLMHEVNERHFAEAAKAGKPGPFDAIRQNRR